MIVNGKPFLETNSSQSHQSFCFQEYREARKEVFGSMKPLSWNTYRDVYDATGIDVDDRKSKLEYCAKFVSNEINAFVGFTKGLPGFCDIDIDDQLAIIKGEYFKDFIMWTSETYFW